ncbi:hypothetical protein [Granulicella sp. dw_53]|nr:hypothetical protein [Granulicella sp. dw_53]
MVILLWVLIEIAENVKLGHCPVLEQVMIKEIRWLDERDKDAIGAVLA